MERRTISIQGVVQGVGFRPFVYGLASTVGLGGSVRNNGGGVMIEVEGEPPQLDEFIQALRTRPPPLARIDRIEWRRQRPRGQRRFEIKPSDSTQPQAIFICPDVATCDDCLVELFDARDRRWRYPFINCTNCGPRLTIIQGAPYDRGRTTMAGFEMCPDCRREYENPLDRRFHAQPIACPRCGPRLALLDKAGTPLPCDDPIAAVARALREGMIVAIKGLGGYHLACDAGNGSAVAQLRQRKHRDEKPFAIMVRDVEAAARICELGDQERDLLRSPRRPIVLLRKRAGAGIADVVAPGNPRLGVMLPYTPLHHLLLAERDGQPLVMTSGNRSDEPIAYEDEDALQRLGDIADLFLTHNRPIHVRCDDSVTRVIAKDESPIRRSRGYAPQPVALPMDCPQPILAVGGQLKNAFALGRDRQAFISQHMGDLDDLRTLEAFERDIELYQQLFAIDPATIVHDLHPDYASTRYAQRRQKQNGVLLLAVQHHHAHLASCMAENGLNEPVIGVIFDGTGYGTDAAVWGGEFLVGDYAGFGRAAHLRYVRMPGGETVIRQPWRMALAHLLDAGLDSSLLENRVDRTALRLARTMLERDLNSPRTSSAGRLFDAIASLAGVRDTVSYEAQAAMQLEWLAADTPADGSYPFELGAPVDAEQPTVIDTRPLIRAATADAGRGVAAAIIARRLHDTLAQIIRAGCSQIRRRTGISRIVFSGGVFMNELLATEARRQLVEDGFAVYQHRLVPPNDGGLCLGQLAIAAGHQFVRN
jgi:hydrogenase maturation protein HypF